MKDTSSKNLRTFTIAAILIFAAIVFMKRDKTDSLGATDVEQLAGDLKTNPRLNETTTSDSEALRNAHTGKWFKNEPYQSEKDQSFEFSQPENTRSQAGAPAKKVDAKKKKKIAKPTKKTKTKLSKNKRIIKGSDDLEGADFDFEDTQTTNAGTYQPRKQQTANKPKEKEQPLTLEQWLELIKKGDGLGKLVSEYKKRKVSEEMFYTIIDKLMQSTVEKDNQSGYRLLAATPSVKSFDKHIEYMNQEEETELQAYAKEQLNVYKSVDNIRVLNAVLNSSTVELKLAANLLVKELAETLIATIESATPVIGEDGVRAPSSVVTRYRPTLQNTLTIINFQLTSGTLDGEATTQFTQTKNLLERILADVSNPPPVF